MRKTKPYDEQEIQQVNRLCYVSVHGGQLRGKEQLKWDSRGGSGDGDGGDCLYEVPYAGDALQIVSNVPQLQVYAPTIPDLCKPVQAKAQSILLINWVLQQMD